MTRLAELVHSKPAVAVLALATHYILHNGEWDNAFHIVLGAWTVAFGGLTVAEYLYGSHANTLGSVVRTSMGIALVYFGVLSTSILLHRGFFHRLRNVSVADFTPRLMHLHVLRYQARLQLASLSSTASSQVYFRAINTS